MYSEALGGGMWAPGGPGSNWEWYYVEMGGTGGGLVGYWEGTGGLLRGNWWATGRELGDNGGQWGAMGGTGKILGGTGG